MKIDMEKALSRGNKLKEQEIRILSVSIVSQKLIMNLENNVCIGEDISAIDELKSVSSDKLKKIEVIGFGGTIHVPETDIFISVDGLMRSLLKKFSLTLMRSIVAQANGSIKSAKKAKSSAGNGLAGGRHKMAKA